MYTATDVLTMGKEILSDPDKLERMAFAKDRNDKPCDEDSPGACKWCAYGVVNHIQRSAPGVARIADYLDNAAEEMFGVCAASVVASRPHDQIMKMFDKAIELSKDGGNAVAQH